MELTDKKCRPCEGGIPPMTDDEEDEYIREVPDWSLDREGVHKLRREFKFKDFKEAMVFINKVADLAGDEGHHPNIHVYYNKAELVLYTHAIDGLFENDFIMAAKIDKLLA